MTEQLRETYFLAVRVILLLILEVYIVLSQSVLTGASGRVLLLLALFVGTMAGKELVDKRWGKWFFLCLSAVLCGIMEISLGREFILLFILLFYELLSFLRPDFFWYCVPLAAACVPSGIGVYVQLLITVLLGMLYIQHDFIVASYRRQTKEDTMQEQKLKHSLYEQENKLREEIGKSLLEEREKLSQTLHDKLGHNINGSIYQLEAVKLLMKKEPEKSGQMVQAVIDQLRVGMDEIRAILRKERPERHHLALLQLNRLCKECSQKGVEAKLITEGNLSQVPEAYLEVILDNAFEAVSNALKYASCTKIEIKIYVMNKVIRCSISDNGVGSSHFTDGMGIAGMRRRIREINGILDFETEAGFTINMLLPR